MKNLKSQLSVRFSDQQKFEKSMDAEMEIDKKNTELLLPPKILSKNIDDSHQKFKSKWYLKGFETAENTDISEELIDN
ncbi:hypothetical protein HK096_003659, partial [Nowakowskiella sp. JEL0078]